MRSRLHGATVDVGGNPTEQGKQEIRSSVVYYLRCGWLRERDVQKIKRKQSYCFRDS